MNVTLTVLAIDYDSFSGTSASAPYVSGVAALVLDADPTLESDEVKDILLRTAENLGNPARDNQFGWGIVEHRQRSPARPGKAPAAQRVCQSVQEGRHRRPSLCYTPAL